ncbi:MAG: TSUP family transporter [Lachnospiraceae bacterium]|nr:TSUP family transporter [Lachnospiraceae bacterium]
MEWLWYIVAALGAGVSTGLAGLSAATVMVPILIVLCPSFAGETGAYQATAIALAADVLGSAVTTYTYGKHKNIDLKRGWIMLVCILTMSTVGSYIAFVVGNVVLGSFTLFLTFFIGIRFLVKPDTSKQNQAKKGEKLDLKGIIISLLFGLTIGFGTGFVGTGGGMMMLLVFTAFLGMELKTAVGTSTFIMTFTALIASVSHILIHPAIVLEKWEVMLVCIAVVTVASLVSARFANRVKNRTVGLVTGAVLTVLGASMLIINYWGSLSKFALFVDTLRSLGMFVAYIIPCVLVLLPIRFFTKIPSFIYRKLLHIVAFSCVTVMMLMANDWQSPALASVVIAAVLYPVLRLLEEEPWYGALFVQKEPGEVRKSLLMLFLMFAAIISVAWGIFGKSYITAAAILMWGTGDAAAALVGIPFGKHKVHIKGTDGKKSWEGSDTMLAVSFICGFCVLFFGYGMSVPFAILLSFIAAFSGTVTELFTSSKYDTVTVPVMIVAVLLILEPIIK